MRIRLAHISKRRTICILVLLIITLITIPLVLGLGPEDTPILWQLFIEWLQGRSKGIIKFNIKPVTERGVLTKFIVFVHNFTDYYSYRKTRSERVYIGGTSFSLLVWRSLLPDNRWKPHYFTIVVRGEDDDYVYFGAKYIEVVPTKPIVSVEVPISVKAVRSKKLLHLSSGIKQNRIIHSGFQNTYPLPEETAIITMGMSLTCLHSISGISVTVEVNIGDYVYYPQKCRYIYCNMVTGEITYSDWDTTGSVAVVCDSSIPKWGFVVSDGTKRWVYTDVTYGYERWCMIRNPIESIWEYYELLTPKTFGGGFRGETVSCDKRGGTPSGWMCTYDRAMYEGKEIMIVLGKGIAPKLYVRVSNWVKNYLVAFDDNTGKKTDTLHMVRSTILML